MTVWEELVHVRGLLSCGTDQAKGRGSAVLSSRSSIRPPQSENQKPAMVGKMAVKKSIAR